MKKTGIFTGTAFAAMALVAAGTYFLAPSGYISLDLNPSVEIRTNRLDRVTSVTGVNSDGKELLEGYRLKEKDLDDVVEDIVDRMVLHGYLGDNQNADILVTVEEGKVKPETLEQVNTKIESYLEYRSLQANVMGQGITAADDLVAAAKEHNVSIGKMSVIQRLVDGDKSLTAEELSTTSLKDLIAYANQKNIPLEFLEDRIDAIDDDKLEHLEDGLDDRDDDSNDIDDVDDRADDSNDIDDLDDRDDDFDDIDDVDDRADDNYDDADDRNDYDDVNDRDDDNYDDADDLADDNYDDVDDRDDDNYDDVNDRNDYDDVNDRDDDNYDDADDHADDNYDDADDHDDDNYDDADDHADDNYDDVDDSDDDSDDED